MGQFRPRWTTNTKLLVTVCLLGLAIFLLARFRAAITPLLLAFVLALVLSPVASWFEQRLHIRRGLATLLAYGVLLILLATVPLIIIPPLDVQSAGLTLNIQNLIQDIERLLAKEYSIAGQTINVDALFRQAVGSIQQLLEPVFSKTLEFAIGAISSIIWVIFVLIVSFYLVKDAQAIQDWLYSLTPPDYREDYLRLRYEISQIWEAFFRGQLTLALVVATIITTVGLVLGLPFALALGVLAGFLEFLPSIGHGIWLTIASLLALIAGSSWLPLPNWAFMLLIIGVHVVFQQFDLNYLIPRIVGRRVHLPPLVVILGIVTGALLAGFLGILLAAPTIASARVLGRYIYANLLDMDPFPDSMASPLPPPNPRFWQKPASQEPVKDTPEKRTS